MSKKKEIVFYLFSWITIFCLGFLGGRAFRQGDILLTVVAIIGIVLQGICNLFLIPIEEQEKEGKEDEAD